MALTIPSKSTKKLSLLVDAIRILAWQEFKATHKEALKDLEYGGYAVFDAEWKEEALHKLSYLELCNFVQNELEYSLNEILNSRSEYYANKRKGASYDSSSPKNPYANEQLEF
jgi:hypothetical protein